jgi:uncharacterized protein (TIGR03083 family)
VIEALSALSDADLDAPSLLPGWTLLTITCHLRFGARTLLDMTADARAGREASYYPGGRDRQRPGTLEPEVGESPSDVVRSLAAAADALDRAWVGVDDDEWSAEVREPPGNPDLGPVVLAHLALSRLTEVEVHGTDLGIGLGDWSPEFAAVALPYRVWRLQLRTPRRTPGAPEQGSWLLRAIDGPSYRVTVTGRSVDADTVEAAGARTAAVIEGSSRDLLALLLGRRATGPLATSGDRALGDAFSTWFPGP